MKELNQDAALQCHIGQEMLNSVSKLNNTLTGLSNPELGETVDYRYSIEKQARHLSLLCDVFLETIQGTNEDTPFGCETKDGEEVPNAPNHELQMMSDRSDESLTRHSLIAFRIVIVDDNHSSGELLAQMLRRIGQSVEVACNGDNAVSMVLTNRPKVVFVKLPMHGMGGHEFVHRLREHKELDEMVLIAIPESSKEHVTAQDRVHGIDIYLSQPTSIEALTASLFLISARYAHHL
ncbi:MAG: response regulator [Pirellula sp.]|nr:response regulator [Pirellula sp.]